MSSITTSLIRSKTREGNHEIITPGTEKICVPYSCMLSTLLCREWHKLLLLPVDTILLLWSPQVQLECHSKEKANSSWRVNDERPKQAAGLITHCLDSMSLFTIRGCHCMKGWKWSSECRSREILTKDHRYDWYTVDTEFEKTAL